MLSKGHRGFTIFSSKSFQVLLFTFMWTIYLEFTCTCGLRKRTNIILPIQIIKCPRTTYSRVICNAIFVHYLISIYVGLFLFNSPISQFVYPASILHCSIYYVVIKKTWYLLENIFQLIFLLLSLPNHYTFFLLSLILNW